MTAKSGVYAEVCRSLFDGLAAPLAKLDAGIATAEDWRRNVREWIGHALRITSATRSPARHPFGYGRIEYFSAVSIAALVLGAGAGSLIESARSSSRGRPCTFRRTVPKATKASSSSAS